MKAEGPARQVGTTGHLFAAANRAAWGTLSLSRWLFWREAWGVGTEPAQGLQGAPRGGGMSGTAAWPGLGAGGHSGRLDHALVGVEDVALEGQAEAHGLGRLQPLCLLRLGCLAPAGTAPLLEGGRQDLLGLGAQATCKAQRGSLSLHPVPNSAVTRPRWSLAHPPMEPGPCSTGLARNPQHQPGPTPTWNQNPPSTGLAHSPHGARTPQHRLGPSPTWSQDPPAPAWPTPTWSQDPPAPAGPVPHLEPGPPSTSLARPPHGARTPPAPAGPAPSVPPPRSPTNAGPATSLSGLGLSEAPTSSQPPARTQPVPRPLGQPRARWPCPLLP